MEFSLFTKKNILNLWQDCKCVSCKGSSFYINDIGHVLPLVYEGVVTFQVFFLARVILVICSLCSRFVTDKWIAEAYSKPCQTSKMEYFEKILYG